MGKKTNENILNPTISLDPMSWLEDFAWWAMRYCIGRKSYASGTWEEMAKVINENWSIFTSSTNFYRRLKFFAADIRSEISKAIGWRDGISTFSDNNSVIVKDAYSLIVEEINKKGINFAGYDFEVDCESGTVSFLPRKIPRTDEEMFDVYPNLDWPGWIKLANSIDRRYKVTVKDENGREEDIICAEVPTTVDYKTKKVEMKFSPISSLGRGWLNPDYIINKERIFINEKKNDE